MRAAACIVLAVLAACASTPDPPEMRAATFRRGAAIEFYDFRLSVSHAGTDAAARVRDCSTERFHCYAGASVLIAPRRCSALRRLVRSREDWRVSEDASARFLFASERQLYYASDDARREQSQRANGAAGFVYDVERGLVGVWRSPAATRGPLDNAAMREIVNSTKWLEHPRALFACAR